MLSKLLQNKKTIFPLADSSEFDNLLSELSQMKFVKPETIEVIKGK